MTWEELLKLNLAGRDFEVLMMKHGSVFRGRVARIERGKIFFKWLAEANEKDLDDPDVENPWRLAERSGEWLFAPLEPLFVREDHIIVQKKSATDRLREITVTGDAFIIASDDTWEITIFSPADRLDGRSVRQRCPQAADEW